MDKAYLGDGVYIDVEPYGDIVLTTENGLSVTNRIVLEPDVLRSFERYLAHLRDRRRQERAAQTPQEPAS